MARKCLSLLSLIAILFLGIPISQSLAIEKPTDDLLASGKKLYSEKCAICHGEKGGGNGEIADLIYPGPRDFTLAVFKIRSTPTGSLPTDEDLFRTISEGMAGTVMLPWKNDMNEKERWALVYFVKTFSDRWKEEKPENPVSISAPPPKTPELLALGKKVYKELKCWECHGEKGKGDGPKSDALKDAQGIPIFPYDFSVSGRMKGGRGVKEIVRTYSTGMDGTPMPAYEVDITDKQRWALAYFTDSLSIGKPPKVLGHQVVAYQHQGRISFDYADAAWQKTKAVEMPVQPLWTWTKKKAIKTIRVRSLYNDREIAFLVEWEDPILNTRFLKDGFSDAVAIQFPLPGETGKAFFGMGEDKRAVNIWQWKADSQVEVDKGPQSYIRMASAVPNPLSLISPISPKRTSPVEDLNAAYPGTLTSQPRDSQQVEGKGVWAGGKWHVVFRRTLKTGDPDDAEFRGGGRYPIAFAVWDGENEDRDGRKSVTPWQVLEIRSK